MDGVLFVFGVVELCWIGVEVVCVVIGVGV